MIREDAERLARRLFAAYPAVQLRDETEAVFVRYFGELDREPAEAAVADLIRTSARFPAIADVRGRIVEHALELPRAIEAYHSLFERGVPLHPLTRYVAEIFGGTFTIRTSDAPHVTRRQFLDVFEELRMESVRRGALPRVVTDAAARAESEPEQPLEEPSIWTAVRTRFDDLPDEERARRVREARRHLLNVREINADWLAAPVIEHEALRVFAEEQGWVDRKAS